MNQTSEAAPSPLSASFASLLASLASGGGKEPSGGNGSRGWDDAALEDDVATLSYESALRAHARYRPSSPSSSADLSLAEAAVAELLSEKRSADGAAPARALAPRTAAVPQAAAKNEAKVERAGSTAFERNLKDSSITIRMSRAECEQLHRRAAEAGLSVSAYLRSCTFEAESLRAMVKDTLAQLRPAATTPTTPAAKPEKLSVPQTPQRTLRGWLTRLFTPGQANQRVARA
ncbi:MAG: hypothetical protein ABR907_05470 [Terracidiphilus sp.]|jgi:predicted DNA binding CopG/RHH family protein